MRFGEGVRCWKVRQEGRDEDRGKCGIEASQARHDMVPIKDVRFAEGGAELLGNSGGILVEIPLRRRELGNVD